MNNINILGTITRDIELRHASSGTAVASFSLAYNEKYNGEDKSHFFDVVAFGKRAETINQYFRKGSRILIGGSLQQERWEKDGDKRSKVSIKLNDFSFIDKAQNTDSGNTRNQREQSFPQQQQMSYDVSTENVPF